MNILKTPIIIIIICLITASVLVSGCGGPNTDDWREIEKTDKNTMTDSNYSDSNIISASEAKEIAYQHAKERYSEAGSSILNDQYNMGWVGEPELVDAIFSVNIQPPGVGVPGMVVYVDSKTGEASDDLPKDWTNDME